MDPGKTQELWWTSQRLKSADDVALALNPEIRAPGEQEWT